jgi:hypothetical protein
MDLGISIEGGVFGAYLLFNNIQFYIQSVKTGFRIIFQIAKGSVREETTDSFFLFFQYS